MTRLLVVQGDDESPPGGLEPPLRVRGAELHIWPAHADDPPPRAEDFDGLLALGGRPDPDDDDAWLDRARGVMAAALDAGIPVLGVCLGAQLLAQAAGGGVEPDVPAEIGWIPLYVDAQHVTGDRVLNGLVDGQDVFSWHSAAIVAPPGADVLATSTETLQAFRVGTTAWGVQFHLEIEPGIAAMWAVKGEDQLLDAGGDPDELRTQTALRAAATQRFADDVAGRLLQVCASTRATKAGDRTDPARA